LSIAQEANQPAADISVNLSWRAAKNLLNKLPVFIAAEHLLGSAHTACNQINENGKQLAFYLPMPEMAHQLFGRPGFPQRYYQTAALYINQFRGLQPSQ